MFITNKNVTCRNALLLYYIKSVTARKSRFIMKFEKNLETKTEAAVRNVQFRDTGNIVHNTSEQPQGEREHNT